MFTSALLAFALAADPKPRLDADGIPLPTEAVRRFGSLRWYADPPRSVAFSPDGKVAYLVPADIGWTIAIDQPPAVTAWDYATGRPLWQFTESSLTGFTVAADQDGKSVWLVGVAGRPDKFKPFSQPFVRVKLDAAGGKELARTKLHRGWSPAHALRPDGTVAWNRFDIKDGAKEGDLTLRITRPDGTEQAMWEGDSEQGITLIQYTPDGKTLYVSGPLEQKFRSRLASVDPVTGKTRWAVTCPEIDTLAVSPDGKTLAAVTASSRLPLPNTDKEVWNEPERVYVARFDAATGESKVSVKVAERNRLRFRHDEPFLGRPIRFTADGKGVLVQTEERKAVTIDVELWTKGKERDDRTVGAWYAPDGKSYLPATHRYAEVAVHDAGNDQPVPGSPPKLPRTTWHSGAGFEFDADGKRLRFGEADFDTATGKEVARVSWAERRTKPMTGVAFLWARGEGNLLSPDGKLMFRQYADDRLGGRERRPSELVEATTEKPVGVKLEPPPDGVSVDMVAFSPDSKWFIGMDVDGTVFLWDVTTGGKPKTENRLNTAGGGGVKPLLKVAEKYALVAEPNWGFDYYDPAQRWTVSRFPFKGFKREKTWRGQGTIEDLATTPVGGFIGWAKVWHGKGKEPTRGLFVVDPGADEPREYPLEAGTGFAVSPDGRSAAFGVGPGDIALYEVATGKRRHTFTGLKRPALSLAFSPDGKTLASESADGPVILWDVKGDLTRPAKPDAAGWDAAWKQLAGGDAEKAFDAVRLFAGYAEGVDELRKRFAEVKSPSVVACERAVEAVRLADTDAGRKLIAEWAKGPADSPLTTAAKR